MLAKDRRRMQDESESMDFCFPNSLLSLVLGLVIVASLGVRLVFMQKCLQMHTVTCLLRCAAVTRKLYSR